MYYDSRAEELAAHLAFVDEVWKRCHGEWGGCSGHSSSTFARLFSRRIKGRKREGRKQWQLT